ncbi:MAG: winged helix-turn-helix transcriptional regulator [Archaeoglobus sp.]|nr:winged helix-turn-helix transcriptional regulator [Archaeoglobus sp.]
MVAEKWVRAKTLEESGEYHRRYSYAVKNATRRKILRLIDEGKLDGEIRWELGLNESQLNYHLKILEWGFCIERKNGRWVITEEGKIVDRIKG